MSNQFFLDKQLLLHKLGFLLDGVYTPAYATALDGVDTLVKEGVSRLQEIPSDLLQGLYLGTSGGKDSVLVQYLADQAFGKGHYPVIHTPKPGVTHPETLKFLYNMDRTITYCPAKLHSQLNLLTQIDGTRRSEFDRTDGRSTNLVSGGKEISREDMTLYVSDGLFGLNFVYPIFDWSDEDVWACILTKEIPFSLEYYVV